MRLTTRIGLLIAAVALTATAGIAQINGPTAPSNLTATPVSQSSIALNWNPATDTAGVTAYYIYRCRGVSCTSFRSISSVSGTSFRDSSLAVGTTFAYEVSAVDGAGNVGPFSNIATATTDTPPTAPANLTAAATSFSQIDLSWTASSSEVGLASYIVQRCKGVSCGGFGTVATIAATSTTYADSGLTEGATYQYRVRAVDTAGDVSTFSNVADSTTQTLPAPVITSATSASGVSGVAFSYQIVATNSPASYGASGLPVGLSINTSTGLISGAPTKAATFSVTLKATNPTGIGRATLTLVVAAGPPAITSGTSGAGTVGIPFFYQITATNSPTSYGASGLPGGLNVNASTGVISGTPTILGNWSVTLSTSNSSGVGTATFALTIQTVQLSLNPSSVVFGSVNVGGSQTNTVTLTNSGSATLNITSATVTGSGYTTSLQPMSINAGASATVVVTFSPATAGVSAGTISIASNASNSPASIALTGTGLQAQIAANPISVAFGAVTDGFTDTQSILLTNTGNAALTFSQVSVLGDGFGENGVNTSTTIAAGGSATLNATFAPSSVGQASGSITLTTNGQPSSLVITLSGTAQAASAMLTASPSSLAFGNVPIGQNNSQTIAVTNTGNSNITISGVAVTGAGFTGSGIPSGTVLLPAQTATLTVAFSPATAGAVTGASVSVTSDATNSPATVALAGSGAHWVGLSWSASLTGGVTYNVFRGTYSGGEAVTPINSSPLAALTYTDTNVIPGTDYYYTVEAVDSQGSSTPSQEQAADVPTP